MCNRLEYRKKPNSRIDRCLRPLIKQLSKQQGLKVLASCCGHGRYPLSVVVKARGLTFELYSGAIITRKARFYKRDADGYYFIPEITNVKVISKAA